MWHLFIPMFLYDIGVIVCIQTIVFLINMYLHHFFKAKSFQTSQKLITLFEIFLIVFVMHHLILKTYISSLLCQMHMFLLVIYKDMKDVKSLTWKRTQSLSPEMSLSMKMFFYFKLHILSLPNYTCFLL